MPSIKELNTFVNYVWDFYAPNSDLYPIKGLTKGHIYDAFFTYKRRIEKGDTHMTWGYGDSLDRERVRDILLENPRFLHSIQTNTGWSY